MRGKLRLIAARDPVDDAVKIHQDVKLFATVLDGNTVKHSLLKGRYAWIQIARGPMAVNGIPLRDGDGAAISDTDVLEMSGNGEALLFDLN
jgi:redox-sensitive bicupin YhaK (pirin superfamily)